MSDKSGITFIPNEDKWTDRFSAIRKEIVSEGERDDGGFFSAENMGKLATGLSLWNAFSDARAKRATVDVAKMGGFDKVQEKQHSGIVGLFKDVLGIDQFELLDDEAQTIVSGGGNTSTKNTVITPGLGSSTLKSLQNQSNQQHLSTIVSGNLSQGRSLVPKKQSLSLNIPASNINLQSNVGSNITPAPKLDSESAWKMFRKSTIDSLDPSVISSADAEYLKSKNITDVSKITDEQLKGLPQFKVNLESDEVVWEDLHGFQKEQVKKELFPKHGQKMGTLWEETKDLFTKDDVEKTGKGSTLFEGLTEEDVKHQLQVHQSKLYRKDPKKYAQFAQVKPDKDYKPSYKASITDLDKSEGYWETFFKENIIGY